MKSYEHFSVLGTKFPAIYKKSLEKFTSSTQISSLSMDRKAASHAAR